MFANPAFVTSSTRVFAPRLFANSTKFAAEAAATRHKKLQANSFILEVRQSNTDSGVDLGEAFIQGAVVKHVTRAARNFVSEVSDTARNLAVQQRAVGTGLEFWI